jgi:hypothetical protein
MADQAGVTFVLIARIPPDGAASFKAYEAQVLPLLPEHGGRLERRLETNDHGIEIHVVWFPSTEAFERFRADPRRTRHAPLLARSGAALELLAVTDLPLGA